MASFSFSGFKDSVLFPNRIDTDRLVFEALPVADIKPQELYEIQSSEEFGELLSHMPGSVDDSLLDTVNTIEDSSTSFQNNNGGSYVIYKQSKEDQIIGRCGLGVNWDIKEAQFYIWLLPEYQGMGYSTERGNAFLELAFDILDLCTVRCGAVQDNPASRKAIVKYIVDNGGVKEGTFRQYKKINGSLEDVVYYSITDDEWVE